MNKALKIAIPAAQVLIASSIFVWYSLTKSVDVSTRYAYPARDIVIKLNFPLAVLWSPILYAMERFSVNLNPASVVIRTSILILFVIAFAASTFLFWYFVVAELEMRSQGKSLIRFTNWFAEICKAVTLFVVGAGALAYAVVEAKRLLHFDRSKTDAFIGGLFLLAWAFALITASIRDLVFFLQKESRATHRVTL
jgi:hypothetical protein